MRREKIKDNILPVTVLSSLILAGAAAPFLPHHAGPLAIAQARKPRPDEDAIPDGAQTQKMVRSHTVAGGTARSQKGNSTPRPQEIDPQPTPKPRPKESNGALSVREASQDKSRSVSQPLGRPKRPSVLIINASQTRLSSASLPDFRVEETSPRPKTPATASRAGQEPEKVRRRHSHKYRTMTPSSITRSQKVRLLRSNYFRSETAFLTALEDISSRLVVVPKPARLSALRAELALIAQDLPAEVDIPVICPAVLVNGAAGRSRHHRIVRINPAEATSLNSAERVPYLLMLEILKEDLDFDPDTQANQELLNKLMLENEKGRRRLFDLTNSTREKAQIDSTDNTTDSVFEPANGDLGNSSLLIEPVEEEIPRKSSRSPLPGLSSNRMLQPPRSSTGATTSSSMATSLSTPRTSDGASRRASSPGPRRPGAYGSKPQTSDQADVSALATHMRTAAQMLAQLDSNGSKRPKIEVAAIKAKIIASMQTLEEQSFYTDDLANNPTFDTIMASADAAVVTAQAAELQDDLDQVTDPESSAGAGAERMENDQKTGGLQRRGDRDDPSAATFGEEWAAKRERIRRSSPYGWMKNWDLVSVIVKTGADLRQEAFACQLIQVCANIWREAGVPVWVKRMRILVTGESSGLIETITNGVSLHSLKRSLTLASIAAGTNPRKRIATLRDHFLKAFGDPDTETYAASLDAFSRSLAAYSIISYVLQLKDRHNGNILLDNFGHIIHIDFGFMLSNSPGSMGFEAAPFKMTQDYVDVLGGVGAPAFDAFKTLCKQAFQALRKEAERIVMLVEMMGRASKMPCFAAGVAHAVSALRARFVLHLSRDEAETFVEDLITKSVGSYYTRL